MNRIAVSSRAVRSVGYDAATRALGKLLETQPNLLQPVLPNEENGQGVADFMAAFIRRYSEHLQALAGETSQ